MSLTSIHTAKILLDTIWRLLKLALFRLVRFAYVIVQRIFWRFNGTARQMEESLQPKNYERSVHVLDILLHHCIDWTNAIHSGQFILAHNRFESPSYIIENDHVTLLTLTDTHAVFAEARDRTARLWNTEYGAFLRLAQIRHCNRLLFVPLEAFHRLAESVGDPGGRLVFLYSTGRCGSTLVVQMLNATDRIVAISEPEAPNAPAYWRPENKHLQRDVIRLVCRPLKTIRPIVYLVKFPSYNARHMSVYQEMFPTSRQLFMYRNTMPSIESQFRMMMGMVTARTQLALQSLLPKKIFEYFWVSMDILDKRFFEDSYTDLRLFGLGMFIESIVYYLDARRNGLDIVAIRYDDILADPMYACTRILETCGAPENLAEGALQGMRTDSQRSSPLARTAVGKYDCPKFDSEFVKSANRVLRKHGLPDIGDELLLEGTITLRNSI